MSDKSIEIRIATTGADQAAADIGKVSAAETRAHETASRHAEEANEKLDRITNIQRAQAAAQLGQAFGKIGDLVAGASQKFADADPEFAATLATVSGGLSAMSSAATLAAQGFAAGGPLGAAIGGLIGVSLPALKGAMDEMISSMEAEAQSAARAETAQTQLNRVYSMGVDAYFDAIEAAEEYKQVTQDLSAALDVQTIALQNRNKVLDAKDAADAATRDRADAAAIRGGAAPEDIKAQRAIDDAEVAKNKARRDQELAYDAVTKADAELMQAEKNVDTVINDPKGRSPEEIRAATAAADKAKEALDKAKENYSGVSEVTPFKLRQIDEAAAGKVENLQFEKQQREKKEQEEADRKAAAAKKKADADALQDSRGGLDDRLGDAQSRLDTGAESAAARLFRGAPKSKTARSVATALDNGTNQDEIEKLTRQVNEAKGKESSAILAAIREMLATLNTNVTEVETLKSQIKNLRPTR